MVSGCSIHGEGKQGYSWQRFLKLGIAHNFSWSVSFWCLKAVIKKTGLSSFVEKRVAKSTVAILGTLIEMSTLIWTGLWLSFDDSTHESDQDTFCQIR
jgi:hypothetical protein